jgi:hypothetical protein
MNKQAAIIAVDTDLHRIHAWCSTCGTVCTKSPDIDKIIQHYNEHVIQGIQPTVLCEIASPVSSQRRNMQGQGPIYQLSKWMIFNVSAISFLITQVGNVLVSPSNKWTRGHDVKTRHKIAGAKSKNKDLRECESMIYFYNNMPKNWVGIDQYLESL